MKELKKKKNSSYNELAAKYQKKLDNLYIDIKVFRLSFELLLEYRGGYLYEHGYVKGYMRLILDFIAEVDKKYHKYPEKILSFDPKCLKRSKKIHKELTKLKMLLKKIEETLTKI